MPHPLRILAQLNATKTKIEDTQYKIDCARLCFPTRQDIQLEMDRLQSDLDEQISQLGTAYHVYARIN